MVIDMFRYVQYDGHMNFDLAVSAFAALSQETRLKVFRILVEYGESGTPAGTVSDRLGIPHNTLSFHLAHLSQVKLVTSRKVGRSVIYAANCDLIDDLIGFLVENCCIKDQKNTPERCSATCLPRPKKGKRK